MRTRTVAVVSLSFILLAGCVRDRPPPITPAALNLHQRSWVVTEDKVAALVKREGGTPEGGVPFDIGSRKNVNVIVVRLDWTPQKVANPDTYLNLVVIDGAGHKASELLEAAPGFPNVAYGWDGRYEVLSQNYPWLAPTAMKQVPSGWTDSAESAYFKPSESGPLWIVARFSGGGIVNEVQFPPVVGVFLVEGDNIWWAVQPPAG